MRAVLTNFGTTGDIQPFLALARELQRRGHEPVLAFSPYFESWATRLGLRFIPIGPDLKEMQNQINAALMIMPDDVEVLRRQFMPLASALPQVLDELSQACRGADVIVSGPAQPVGRMVHELTGIPFVSLQLSHFGGIGSPALRQVSGELINPFRARWRLPPLQDPLTIDANSPQLALYAMSRYVRPPQAGWPSHYHMTGFFFLDDGRVQQDADLQTFLEGDGPVVVFTFGSMTHADPTALTDLLIEAVCKAGVRAVLQKSWEGVDERTLPSGIYRAGYVPHDWLFQRASCIVHHGGGGTAGAVFRSGVPSIFVPHGHIFDQHYWAFLAQEAGCAGPPIPFPELSAEALAAAITTTLTTSSYRERAAWLGEQIRQEPGVKSACRLIEELVHRIGLSETAVSLPTNSSAVPGARTQKLKSRRELIHQRRSSMPDPRST
jgi:sterol 3beta-glucosyltransferase